MIFWRPKNPVFILGCQRSGTTICEEVFRDSRQFAVFSEGSKRAMSEGYRLRDLDEIDALIASTRKSMLMFKPLNDSHWGDRFLERWPRARVIWIWRDVHDTVNSAVTKWGDAQRDIVYAIVDAFAGGVDRDIALARLSSYTNNGMYAERMPLADITMLAGWAKEGLSAEAGAAAVWWMRNKIFFDLELDAEPRALLVRYEDFVAQPGAEIRRICEFMGASYKKRLASKVHAGSIRKSPPPTLPAELFAECQSLEFRLEQAYRRQRSDESHAETRAAATT